jgi:sugar lactone lactonase YvrE
VGASNVVQERTPTGTLVQTLHPSGASITTGSAFDHAGNFYTTVFNSSTGIVKFDPNGTEVGPVGSGYTGEPESISFDKAGNFYVGAADTNVIRKFDATGKPLATYTVATEDRGTDWTEVAADQHTLFYTSEGHRILRFDTLTNKQLPDFNATPLPGSNAYAHRLLPTGGMLVADTDAVRRLDASGNVVQTYTPMDSHGLLFALNLDPDGKTFWTADLETGNVYRFDIATGKQLIEFNSGVGGVDGLSVKGEITVGGGGTGGPAHTHVYKPVTYSFTVNPITHIATFEGDIYIKNTGTTVIQGPITAVFHLPKGASLLNPTDPGEPDAITVDKNLAPHRYLKVHIKLQIDASAWAGIGHFYTQFSVTVLAGGG